MSDVLGASCYGLAKDVQGFRASLSSRLTAGFSARSFVQDSSSESVVRGQICRRGAPGGSAEQAGATGGGSTRGAAARAASAAARDTGARARTSTGGTEELTS